MPNRVTKLAAEPLLDIRSFARRGPGHPALTPAVVEQLARTVGRARK